MRRISYMSDSCWKNTSFSPQEQNSFAQNQLMSYFSEKKHYCPLKMISIEAESHFLSKLIRRITALPWRHNICLGRMSVSESPHESFCPSLKNEYLFLTWLFFTRDWLCLCEESHSKAFLLINSLYSSEVWIFYWEESFAFTGFCWVIERIDFLLTQ